MKIRRSSEKLSLSVRVFLSVFSALLLTTHVPCASAQNLSYPTKPIRFVVPYPPGGGTDDVARIVADKLSKNISQTVVVENKAGASGMIAGEFVARSTPDGYTIMIDQTGIVINAAIKPKMPYDVRRDLIPITHATTLGNFFLVNPSVPARNIEELIALAKSQPGKLKYASTGNGQPIHIDMEKFKSMAGLDFLHIPYKGGAPAIMAVLSGEVQMALMGTSCLPHVQAGKVRPLAFTSLTRSKVLPDVPTVSESGLKGYTSSSWLGIFAPAKTPAPIIAYLNAEFVKALKAPDVQKKLMERNFEVVASTPEAFGKVIEEDLLQYQKLIRDLHIETD